LFSTADLELIRLDHAAELACTICENLPWKAPNGQLRVHGCRALLERLAAGGVVTLPAKAARVAYRPAGLRGAPVPAVEIVATLGVVRPVTVEPVSPGGQAVWDATMALHHALGSPRAVGAHQRYWIRGEVGGQRVILGALLFAAAARSVAVRDAALGWRPQPQQRFRYRLVANSRFLILLLPPGAALGEPCPCPGRAAAARGLAAAVWL